MTSDIETQAEELLEIESQDTLVRKIAEITDERLLNELIHDYNWDDGFAVPEAIISNPNCGISTALSTFYLADGISYLKNKSAVEGSSLELWKNFVIRLYHKIVDGGFERSCMAFTPPLSRVEMYKLKKGLNPSEQIFIEEIKEEKDEMP